MPSLSRVTEGWGASQTCAYCHGFSKIPSLIRGSDGQQHLNPDVSQIKDFVVRAEPFGFVLPAGESQVFSITAPAEDDSLGDFLVQELHGLFDPRDARSITVEFLSNQTDKVFQNAPIFNTLILGNSHLSCCLPCCTLIQATNTLSIRVTNNEAVPVTIMITARGTRFLPRTDAIRARMLEYWNSIPSYPYFLTMDEQELVLPAGAEETVFMTVPGTGDFEVVYPRCEVIPDGAGTDYNDIILTSFEGIGRQLQSDEIPLGAFYATPTIEVTGFPGNLYRAASACSCPIGGQLFKRNTKVRHTLRNDGADQARIRITYAGCFHNVDECPPGRSINRLRSLEPTIGPLLIPQRDFCPPQSRQPEPVAYEPSTYEPPVYAQPAVAPMAMPAGPRSMHVPGVGMITEGVPGPYAYLWQYYEPGPNGMAVPKQQLAQAHGVRQGGPFSPGFPMAGMGSMQSRRAAPMLAPGQAYWDPIARGWRRA